MRSKCYLSSLAPRLPMKTTPWRWTPGKPGGSNCSSFVAVPVAAPTAGAGAGGDGTISRAGGCRVPLFWRWWRCAPTASTAYLPPPPQRRAASQAAASPRPRTPVGRRTNCRGPGLKGRGEGNRGHARRRQVKAQPRGCATLRRDRRRHCNVFTTRGTRGSSVSL